MRETKSFCERDRNGWRMTERDREKQGGIETETERPRHKQTNR